jgi:chaperonin GroES
MSLGWRPVLDRVVCAKPNGIEKLASGVLIPKTFDEQEEAEVIAVGPGKFDSSGRRVPMQTQVGDRVLFNKYQVQTIRVHDKDYLVLRDEDVRAVVSHARDSAA